MTVVDASDPYGRREPLHRVRAAGNCKRGMEGRSVLSWVEIVYA
jgi:hypothetical protein